MEGVIRILDLSYEELRSLFEERYGEPAFRADQVGAWIYRKRLFDVNVMTDLSLALRERLAPEVDCRPPYLAKDVTSERDGTKKYLWRLDDGETVESVLLVHDNRKTACLSTQVGCPLACAFCATGQGGYVRDLSAGEIVGQFLAMEAQLGQDIANIVFMGMGEPLLNVEALLKAIAILNHPKFRGMGIRRFTVSTAGIVPAIRRLAQEAPGVGLSISLHAPNDGLRSRLMPVDRRYPLGALMAALHDYQERTGNRVSFEYLLLAGVNDEPAHARDLAALISGLKAYVNLIPFNAVEGTDFRRSSRARIETFRQELQALGVEVEARSEKGGDIDAACGQLRRREASGGSPSALREGGRDGRPRREGGPREGGRDDRSRREGGSREGGRDDRPRREGGPREGGRDDRPRREGGSREGGRDDRPRREGGSREGGRDDRPRREGGPREGGRDGRPRREGGSREGGRDDRPRREGGPREGGRDDRPRREGGPREGGRDDRPRREGGPREGGRDDRPRREGAPRKEGKPDRDFAFSRFTDGKGKGRKSPRPGKKR
ncbi:MAG: 23S rRNA (adenine(2503)-C(2))-methyltransferase RlmN [Synergistaceae bacterium]|nr:23S rRNA (adenine(2503)-C(2))-methyltransferase RlmN [Synergistaceae bacterium]